MVLCSCCPICHKNGRRKIVLLLVGLDNSGKTTAAKGLAGDNLQNAVPTIGFSAIKLKHRGFDVIIYDLGGGSQIRAVWKSYFSDVHGVIFVVDASDATRIEESKNVLESLLRNERLAGKPVLVLANKQDKSGAMDEIDIVEALKLEPLVNEQKCLTLVEICSALQYSNRGNKIDRRLLSGYRWLLNQIIQYYNVINTRVQNDIKIETLKIEAQRNEWRKKINEEATVNGNNHNMLVFDNSLNRNEVSSWQNRNGIKNSDSDEKSVKSISSDREDITRIVREQFQRKSFKQRHKMTLSKYNKIIPLENSNHKPRTDTNDCQLYTVENDQSLTLQALTSPKGNQRQEKKMASWMRPSTSKSLGQEGLNIVTEEKHS